MVQKLLYIGKAKFHTLSICETSKYQTSLYRLSKNHRVITLLENSGSVRRNLQSTVSLDHPVVESESDFSDLIGKSWKNKYTESTYNNRLHRL